MFSERHYSSRFPERHGRRWRRLALPGAALCALLARPPAAAEGTGNGLEVLRLSPAVLQARPGEIVSLSFRVTALTAAPAEVREGLQLPEGWQALVPPTIFTLSPGVPRVRLAAVAVGAGAPAGEYTVRYEVVDPSSPARRDSDVAKVRVLPSGRLSLALLQPPDLVLGGQEGRAVVHIRNRGNEARRVRLQASAPAPHRASVQPETLDLAAGAQAAVTVTLHVSAGQEKSAELQVQVQATDATAAGTRTAVLIPWRVLPPAGRGGAPQRRLHATLTARLAGEGSAAAGQLELQGAGYLDSSESRHLSFDLRGPDVDGRGVLSDRDQYRLTYETPRLQLKLGDQVYGNSSLIGSFRYGRGLGLETGGADGLRLGAYVMRDPWGGPIDREAAGYLTYRVSDTLAVQTNLVTRQQRPPERRDAFEDRLYSLQARYAPGPDLAVDVEYSRCDSSRPSLGGDEAWRFRTESRAGDATTWTLSAVHADSGYRGAYQGVDYRTASLATALSDSLRLHAEYGSWRQQPLSERLREGSQERLGELGLRIDLGGGLSAGVDYQRFERLEGIGGGAADLRESGVRFSLGQSGRRLAWRTELRLAELSGAGDGHSTVSHTGVYLFYRPSDSLSVSAYARAGSDPSLRRSRLLGNCDNLGVALDWTGSEWKTNLYWQRYSSGDSDGSQLRLELSRLLPDERSLRLAIHRNDSPFVRSNFSYLLEYCLPLDLPLGPRTDVGGLRGSVSADDGEGVRGLAGAVVVAGDQAAVTDAAGRFSFPALPPGEHLVQLERRSIGLQRVPALALPLPVTVVGGQVTEVTLPCARAATVAGRVVIEASSGTVAGADGQRYLVGASGPQAGPPPSTGGLEVVLTDGTRSYRRLTDSSGAFSFEDLPPGRWRLKLAPQALPPHLQAPADSPELEVHGGDTRTCEVRLTPRLRRIKMLAADDALPASATTATP